MPYPGIDAHAARLRRLSPQLRTALACACADRIVHIYQSHHVEEPLSEVAEAIEAGWMWSTTGSSNRERLAVLIEIVQDEVKYLNEEDIGVLAAPATVVLRVLQSIGARDDASALAVARALGTTLQAAQLADKLAHSPKPRPKLADDEEIAWQHNAFALIERWQAPCTRDMFEPVGASPPRWWHVYEAGSQHL